MLRKGGIYASQNAFMDYEVFPLEKIFLKLNSFPWYIGYLFVSIFAIF